jgi:DnaJ-domain-containing protein 1
MSNNQPKALRLADLFDLEDDSESLYRQASAELRRLHDVNTDLLEALNRIASLSMSQFANSYDMAEECLTIADKAVRGKL